MACTLEEEERHMEAIYNAPKSQSSAAEEKEAAAELIREGQDQVKEMKPGSTSSISTLILMVVMMLISSADFGNSLLQQQQQLGEEAEFSRHDFPPDIIFGAGTSAYQVEGAVAEDGRSRSGWDTFTHAGGMPDKSTADVTSDGYHKYKEDVKLMADTGLDSYRFSISWSRLIPDGRGAVNPKGLRFYNNLIDELLKYGIEPHVTLYHLDLPQVLEDEYGGWLSTRIIDDFTALADVCFSEFGDRVPRWTTLDEPNIMAVSGFDLGAIPPNRCSHPFGIINCTDGDSTREPYVVLHHALLAHASVFNLYKRKYQATQKGQVGINVFTFWYYPASNSTPDIEASWRAMDFTAGWVLNPIVSGEYPEIMKKNAGSRLPSFTEAQSEQVKGSFDYIAINHYTSVYTSNNLNASTDGLRDYCADYLVLLTGVKDGTASDRYDPFSIRAVVPDGLEHLLDYVKDKYGNPPLFIEENGLETIRGEDDLNDTARIDYLSAYMNSTLKAIRKGANVKGYFVWSFLDVFEVVYGYKMSFGLYRVDFDDKNLTRMPKLSAHWYSNFLKSKGRRNGMKIKRAAVGGGEHT